MASKRLVAAQLRFQQRVVDALQSLGAVRTHERYLQYRLTTPAGLLNISIYENWIATCFDNVLLGANFSNAYGKPCNPYSGKWNWHYNDAAKTLVSPHIIDDFLAAITALQAYTPPTEIQWRPSRWEMPAVHQQETPVASESPPAARPVRTRTARRRAT